MGAVSEVVGGRLRAREEMVRAWGRSGMSWVEGRIVRGGWVWLGGWDLDVVRNGNLTCGIFGEACYRWAARRIGRFMAVIRIWYTCSIENCRPEEVRLVV